MNLVEITGNPIPADPIDGFLQTPDGVSLRYARWRTLSFPAKGTVLILHGRAECIEKTFETVTRLRNDGFDVFTFDWRGQGGSSRLLSDPMRGHVDSFDEYITDLNTCMEEVVLPDCPGPYYILAHSTGALVSLLAAPGFANRIRRMVLCAPLLHLGKIPVSQSTLKFLTGLMTAIGLGGLYLSGGKDLQINRSFATNRLTSDPIRFARNKKLAVEHPELCIGGPTAGWLFAAMRAMERLEESDYHGRITIPTLLIRAGADEVVDAVSIERLGRSMRSGSTLVINGARHELMHERDIFREQMLSAFDAFVPGTEYVKDAS